MTDMFERFDAADVRALIAEYPLAWLIGPSGRADEAAQLPLLGEYDADGTLMGLLGHNPRRHPLVSAWRERPAALVLIQGPHGYISPEHAGFRNWAPTWNFAQLSIEAEVDLLPEETAGALASLVRAMEEGRAEPWQVAELGDRYSALEQHVVAFRARVKRLNGRFKLGQDERSEVRASIIRSLGDTPLAAWMKRVDRVRGS